MYLLGSILLATTFHSTKGVQFGNTYSYFVEKKETLSTLSQDNQRVVSYH